MINSPLTRIILLFLVIMISGIAFVRDHKQNIGFNHTLSGDVTSDSLTSGWYTYLQRKGLVLENPALRDLRTDPASHREIRQALSQKYPVLLKEIEIKRDSLSNLYKNADSSEKVKILNDAEKTITWIIEKAITPLWIGGAWDINGVPGKRPDLSRPVACGHFVQKILDDAGFNIQKNQETWLAYLSTRDLIKSLSGSEPKSYASWEDLNRELEKQGEGLYVFGLDCGWGHVLFGRNYDHQNLLLIHSGPSPGGAGVSYDDGKSYISEFCGERIRFVKINSALTEKWLLSQPIKPCVVME